MSESKTDHSDSTPRDYYGRPLDAQERENAGLADRFDSLYDARREVFTLTERRLFFWTATWLLIGVVIGRLA